MGTGGGLFKPPDELGGCIPEPVPVLNGDETRFLATEATAEAAVVKVIGAPGTTPGIVGELRLGRPKLRRAVRPRDSLRMLSEFKFFCAAASSMGKRPEQSGSLRARERKPVGVKCSSPSRLSLHFSLRGSAEDLL